MDTALWLTLATAIGPVGAVLVIGFTTGWLRTKQEVGVWRERTKRAEDQVDTLLPAVNHLTDSVFASLREAHK